MASEIRNCFGFFLVSVLCFGWASCSEGVQKDHHAKLKVAATIFPIADIAKQIAGDDTEVVTILPPGANPHAFELAPKAVHRLQGARVVFVIGHYFDEWAVKISGNVQGIKILPVHKGLDLIVSQDGVTDPHYWLSIRNAKQIARNIAEALAEVYPEETGLYRKNLESYLSVLEETDRAIKQLFSELTQRKLVTYHDGWRYFASDFGFEIIGTVESIQGNEPTPGRLSELGKAVSQHNVRTLFSEPGVSKRTAESIANDFGLLLRELDPFGGSGDKKSFTDLMMTNAQAIHGELASG